MQDRAAHETPRLDTRKKETAQLPEVGVDELAGSRAGLSNRSLSDSPENAACTQGECAQQRQQRERRGGRRQLGWWLGSRHLYSTNVSFEVNRCGLRV